MRAAAGRSAEARGVRFRRSRKRDRSDASPSGSRHRRERHLVPPRGDDSRRAERDSEQGRRGSVGAGRAGHDEGLAGRQASAQEAAERNDEAGEDRKLRRVALVEPFERGRRLDRNERVFGQRAVGPVGEHRLGARPGRQADQHLLRIVHVLARHEMRGQRDALAGLQAPDVPPDRLDHADAVGSDRELALWRIVEGQFSFDVAPQIGHEDRRLDPDERAAGTRLGHGNLLQLERASKAAQAPGLHVFRAHPVLPVLHPVIDPGSTASRPPRSACSRPRRTRCAAS